jgi:hypothetical protein
LAGGVARAQWQMRSARFVSVGRCGGAMKVDSLGWCAWCSGVLGFDLV